MARIVYMTEDELHRLLAAAKAVRERDWLMILVAYLHGLRASEVTQLTADNVSDGYLIVKRLKGRKKPATTRHRLRQHGDSLLDERHALIELARKSKPGARLFPIGRTQFWNLMRKYGASAGVPRHKCHPHALKHTCGTKLAPIIGVRGVQEFFGHKSIASTGIYIDVDEQRIDEAAAEAVGAGRPHQRRLNL